MICFPLINPREVGRRGRINVLGHCIGPDLPLIRPREVGDEKSRPVWVGMDPGRGVDMTTIMAAAAREVMAATNTVIRR